MPTTATFVYSWVDMPAGQAELLAAFALQVHDALPDGVLTPPTVARFLGVYSMAVYQAFAVWSPPTKRFLPLPSNLLTTAIPAELAQRAGTLPANPLYAQQAAISGAAFRFTTLFFQSQPTWSSIRLHFDAVMSNVGDDDSVTQPVAFQQGTTIADAFYNLFNVAALLDDTASALPASIANIRPSQPSAAVTNCSDLEQGW